MEGGPGSIVLELERKLNKTRFGRRTKRDKYCKISINYYWDLLKYIDDDYLTEWEVLKFKDLYVNQLGNMICQCTTMAAIGYGLSTFVTAPFFKITQQAQLYRMPTATILIFFLMVQNGFWMRPNKHFHEIM